MRVEKEFTFSIRDDDINFYTPADELRSIYEPIFEICKPTLCITPFAGDVYKSVRDNKELLTSEDIRRFLKSKSRMEYRRVSPIHLNPDLVDLLREWIEDNKICVALHGVTHDQTEVGYECEVSNNLCLLEKSKTYLELLLNTQIRVFSAPNNSINKRWRNELEAVGMDLVMSYGPKPSEIAINFSSIFNLTKLYFHFAKYRKKFFYPFPMMYRRNVEFSSFPQSVFRNFDDSVNAMLFCHSKGGNFIFATHSYAFDSYQHMLPDLRELALKAQEMGARMVGIDEICGDLSSKCKPNVTAAAASQDVVELSDAIMGYLTRFHT